MSTSFRTAIRPSLTPGASSAAGAPAARAVRVVRACAAARVWLAAAACALTALVLLAGCGSSPSTGTSADPAGVTPASAAVYVGAVVRPSGSLQSAAQAVGQTLTHQNDPYTRLVGLLQTPGSPTLTYSADVAPWLGPNAGLFITSLGSGSEALTDLLQQGLTGAGGSSGAQWPFSGGSSGPQGAIVLDTSDLSAANTFVANAAAHAGAHTSSYSGVSLQVTPAGDAFAVVDRFVVLGTESGVRAVIDTARGASSSLKSASTYSQLQSVAPSGVLAHVYANPSAVSASSPSALASSSSSQGTAIIHALAGGRPLNVSLVPSSSQVALDADAAPAPSGSPGAHGSGGGSSGGSSSGGGISGDGSSSGGSGGLIAAAAAGNRALSELPGESWLAAGLGNVGATAGGSLEGLHSLLGLVSTLGSSGAGAGVAAPQAAFSVKGLLEGLLTPLSALSANTAQARRAYLSWMGDAGVFASGTSVLELRGGVVIDSTNPSASRAAVATLGAALHADGAEVTPTHVAGAEAAIEAKITGLPLPLVIADGHSSSGQAKFVMGLGAASVQDALNPPSTMLTSAAYSSAAAALGEGIQPSIAADFSTLLSLLESVGLAEDPTISPFTPYLRSASTLSGGGKSLGGGIERLRLVLGLRSSGSGSG